MENSHRTRIREFIRDNFLFREDREMIADSESLLELGVIDSTGVLELVAYLETEFGLDIADADIIPDNLDSIERIDGFVTRKLSDRAAA